MPFSRWRLTGYDIRQQIILRFGEMIHIHVAPGSPLGSGYMTQSGTITSLQSGLVRSAFPVTNSTGSDKPVLIVMAVVEKSSNQFYDFALVQKTIPANSTETILAGATVLANAENYELRIVIWDSLATMNVVSNQVIFR